MNDREVAERLAKITGRPASEFYKEPEVIKEVDNKYDPSLLAEAAKWRGEIIRGKLHRCERQMTRKEYLDMKKQLKTEDEFWSNPHLFLMFRSEGQIEQSFIRWVDLITARLP